jgi:hypothetical protein
MHTVLGLSMTPTAVGFVLVEGQQGDGDTIDHDAFAVHTDRGANAVSTSEQVAAAVFRTQAITEADGYQLHSVGVTWSDGADAEASLLLKSLTDSGFDNVVAVRLPEATEALARGVGSVIGYDQTAVCVIESEAVVVLVDNTRDGAVQTAVSHAVDSNAGLVHWLTDILDQGDWQPDALVVVGTGALEEITALLEEVLPVPVFAPAEAELALARGAALASAQNTGFGYAGLDHDFADDVTDNRDEDRRPWALSQTGALSLLIVGVLTFVVSMSLLVSTRLVSDSGNIERRQVVNTSGTPAMEQAVAPAVPPPPQVIPPPVVQTPVELAPPPVAPDIPVVQAPQVNIPDDSQASLPPEPVPAAVAPEPIAPPPPPPPVASVPAKKPGILTRIRDRLHIGDNPIDQQAPAEVPPPAPDVPFPPP